MDRNGRPLALSWAVSASLSARRAWIEIYNFDPVSLFDLSLSARRAWIEIGVDFAEDWLNASLSARRAWIEITQCKL